MMGPPNVAPESQMEKTLFGARKPRARSSSVKLLLCRLIVAKQAREASPEGVAALLGNRS